LRTHRREGIHVTRWREGLPVLRTLLLALVVTTSALVPSRAHAEDTLFLADGIRKGSVEGYSGGVCIFDGASVPRASIYFIGLDAELPPPALQDPIRDEVHLRDGSVHPGPLVSIDVDNVATESASFARKDVAWIWLTPLLGGQGQAAPSTTATEKDEEEERPSYAWAGIIKVENRYDGRVGRHQWQAEYRLKLLEVPTNSSKPGRYPLAVSFPTNNLEPIELEYEILADQNWDGEGYKVAYGANNVLISGDVTMRGHAGGRISGQTLVNSRVLLGDLLRLDAPATVPQPPTAGIATEADYNRYQENVHSPAEPGWYYISIGFGGHDMDYGGETGPPARLLSVYDGIVRGGLHPPFFDDPYLDLVHWIPAYGSDVVLVGRLDDPDQAEVRGALSFSRDGNVGPGEHITIEWSFMRTRQ
jgi:hypothetical protein